MLSEKSKERYKAWWKCELVDRVLIQSNASIVKNGRDYYKECESKPSFPISKVLAHNWKEKNFDNDYIVEEKRKLFTYGYYAGDAFPMFYLNIGPSSLGLFTGCIPEFRKETIWNHPPKDNEWKHLNKLEIDPNNKYWRIMKDMAKKASDKNNNNYYINAAGLFTGLDIIASFRETQQLLFDLVENPEEVKKFNKFITRAFKYFYDGLYEIVHPKQEGFIGFLPIWCDKRSISLACDFSAMISSRMFEEFAVPELIACAKHLDNVVYHLDGPESVRHLDILLDIKEIDAIQWTPGAGSLPTSEWIPMYKKIQAKKKSLYLFVNDLDEIEKLITELEPEGLLITINTDSVEKADHIVKRVEDLTLERLKRRQTSISRN